MSAAGVTPIGSVRMSPGARGLPVLAVVAVLALVNRLLPVLRGGGLDGVLGYDDAVYYAGAVALVHGQVPYEDFLFLHPPGVLLALAPIAALGRGVGETPGWEISRILWMLLGCLTSVIIAACLLRLGRLAALAGGCAYALFPGAVLVERTTMVEGLTNLCLAGALALVIGVLSSTDPGAEPQLVGGPVPGLLLAGALLGLSAASKIWGIVPLVVIAVFVAVALGVRWGLVIAGSAAVVTMLVCLPFFLNAPGPMWQMVVLDQLGRSQGTNPLARLAQVVTLGRDLTEPVALVMAGVALVGLIAGSLLVWRLAAFRVVLPLLIGMIALLAATPIFYPHYVAILAVPGSVMLGAGTGVLVGGAASAGPRRLILIIGALLLALDLVALTRIVSGTEVPPELRGAVRPAPGCLTSDDPNNLLALGVVGRNVQRDCELVVDLGGYSHHLSRGRSVPRSRNADWQRVVVGYLETGEYALVTRFAAGRGLSRATAAEIESWPIRVSVDGFDLRKPP